MLTKEQRKEGECLWSPTDKQQEFLSSSFDEVLYGGSAGGGKSDALLIDALGLQQNALRWNRYKAILFRKTFPELGELVDRSKAIYPLIFPGATYSMAEHEWRFPSGAKILFGYMDKDEDRYKHQGSEYQWVGWDELTHWATPVCYKYLQSRTRSTNANIKVFTRATTNPGGRGHAWVKNYWQIPNSGSGTQYCHTERISGYEAKSFRQFIPAKLDDNPFLSESGYREMLLKLPEKDRKKLLEGRWDVTEGQFFTNWDPMHHIVDPFEVPPTWPRWRAMDWGKTRPYSVGWYTVDPDGVVYRYKELYGWGGEPNVGTGESPKQVCKKIIEMEKHERAKGIQFRSNPADPSCWYHRGEGISIQELFRDNNIIWDPAKGGAGSRENGWNVCNQRLEQKTFKVFAQCKHFIRTIPNMQIDEARPEDIETKFQEDHVADEWRYSMVSRHRFERAEAKRTKPPYMSFDYLTALEPVRRKKSKYRF